MQRSHPGFALGMEKVYAGLFSQSPKMSRIMTRVKSGHHGSFDLLQRLVVQSIKCCIIAGVHKKSYHSENPNQ